MPHIVSTKRPQVGRLAAGIAALAMAAAVAGTPKMALADQESGIGEVNEQVAATEVVGDAAVVVDPVEVAPTDVAPADLPGPDAEAGEGQGDTACDDTTAKTDEGAADTLSLDEAGEEEAPVPEAGTEAEGASGQAADDAVAPAEAAPTEGDADDPAAASMEAQATVAATPAPTTPKGIFALETGLSYRMVMDVAGGSVANGANVRLYRSNNTVAQRWRLEFYGDRCYVVNIKSGLVLDVAGGKAVKGANVQQYRANATNAQLWIPEARAAGGWILRSVLNRSLVLDVAGGKAASGTNLRLWTSNGSSAQAFWFREVNPAMEAGSRVIADGAYIIRAGAGGGQVLDVKGEGMAKGTNVQSKSSSDANGQRFYATYANGFYTFKSVLSGLALDVVASSPVAGANVQLYTANQTPAQQWKLVSAGKGLYTLINRGTGLVLDLAGGKKADGTNVWGYYANGSAAQTWSFAATTLLGDGCYVLKDRLSGKVLDVAGASTEAGAVIQRHNANGTWAQRFNVTHVSGAATETIEIKNVNSAGWVSDAGGAVVQAKTRDTWQPVWDGSGVLLSNGSGKYLGFARNNSARVVEKGSSAHIVPITSQLLKDGYYQIRGLVGTVLDTEGQSTKEAYAVASNAGGSLSQVWLLQNRGNGRYSLINEKSGMALGLSSTANGARARQTAYKAGAANQLWTVVWDSVNGGIVFENMQTRKALSVSGASAASGAMVVQSDASASLGQSWRLIDKTVEALRERMAQVAEHFASDNAHGYSIPNRGCGQIETITMRDGVKVKITNSDVDCSEMMRQCANAALGFNKIGYMDTRCQDEVLKKHGFVRMAFSASAVRRGDILWCYGHTGMALGGGKQADAHQDENGELIGPRKGDQTGHEVEIRTLRGGGIWTYIYRYVG